MKYDNQYDIIVIGAGVVGCAIAREFAKYKLKIAVLEKENDVCEGISKANSGVLHAGFNVSTNSLKARFNLEGLNYFPALAQELNISYQLCKKLVIAKNDTELNYLEKLLTQGRANGCRGLSIITRERVQEIQPNIKCKYALLSKTTAIISPFEFTIALAENAEINGTHFIFYSEVISIQKHKTCPFIITTVNHQTYYADTVINAAGLNSIKIANMLEPQKNKILPVRGEYHILDCNNNNLLKTAIYPVPPKNGLGLGIHLTPTINGNILIGPSAESIGNYDDTKNTHEIMQQLKQEAYAIFPVLKSIPIIKSFSGIRPKLAPTDQSNPIMDFIIQSADNFPNFINLFGIESPGLTSAPAIAKYVTEKFIAQHRKLKIKNNFRIKKYASIRTKNLTFSKLKQLTKNDIKHAEIICRCEQVTKKEVLQAIKNSLNTKTFNAIKKRTHCTMGRCQGGFCLPKICEILINEFGLSPQEIVKNNQNSHLLIKEQRHENA